MTDEQLATLEKMRDEVAISAAAEIFQHFPEIAKDLREARAERDNLAHELKCSNETIDMLYEKSRRYVEQVDKYEAEAKRLKEIVATYDDRFATLYDEKGKEIKRLQAQVDGNGMLLTAISMVVGDRPGLVEAVQQLKKERDDLALQLEDRADSEYHLRETLNEVNAENLRLKADLKEVRAAYEYYRKHAASILNNTADPEET